MEFQAAGQPVQVHCWACAILVEVPFVDGKPSEIFKCGWCGAISESYELATGKHTHKNHAKGGRSFASILLRAIGQLQWIVVAFVTVLTASIIGLGTAFILPRLAGPLWMWSGSTFITWILSFNTLFNYFAAVFASPGTVSECCILPSHYHSKHQSSVAASQSGGGNAGGQPGGSTSQPSSSELQHNSTSATGLAQETPTATGSTLRARNTNGHGSPMSGAPVQSSNATGSTQQTASVSAPQTSNPEPTSQAPSNSLGPAQGSGPTETSADGVAVPPLAFANWRYCWHCKGPKSPDSHHCRMCRACIVDMDHHCPFINNCVGRANQRNFVLFLAWTLVSMTYCILMCGIALTLDRKLLVGNLRAGWEVGTQRFGLSGSSRMARFLDLVVAAAIALMNLPAHLLAALYIVAVGVALGIAITALLVGQLRSIAVGMSYIEQLKHQQSGVAVSTSFSSAWRNFQRVLGGPSVLNWLWPRWGPPEGVLIAGLKED